MIKAARELEPGDIVLERDPDTPDIIIDRYVIAKVWNPTLRPGHIATLAAGDKISIVWRRDADVEIEDLPPIGDPGPYLSHMEGCRNNDHNPATTLCTNELMWPWTV